MAKLSFRLVPSLALAFAIVAGAACSDSSDLPIDEEDSGTTSSSSSGSRPQPSSSSSSGPGPSDPTYAEAPVLSVIEPTRALVAVDVNTGADTTPAASLKANVAAAKELPRQLRLRGLGGQVVIDFAPMPKRDRTILDQVMKAAFKSEGEVTLAGWTTMGLYEMTRRRDRLVLRDLMA